MVAVPAAQGFVAGVFKQKLQLRGFNVAVTKQHVGLALMARRGKSCGLKVRQISTIENESTAQTVANRHHPAWADNFRFANGRKQFRSGNIAAMNAERVRERGA